MQMGWAIFSSILSEIDYVSKQLNAFPKSTHLVDLIHHDNVAGPNVRSALSPSGAWLILIAYI